MPRSEPPDASGPSQACAEEKQARDDARAALEQAERDLDQFAFRYVQALQTQLEMCPSGPVSDDDVSGPIDPTVHPQQFACQQATSLVTLLAELISLQLSEIRALRDALEHARDELETCSIHQLP